MPTPIRSLKLLLIFQFLVAVVGGALLAALGDLRLGASFAVGAGLMWVNVALLGWSTWRTLERKSVALTTMIIVIKYAVLLGSIVIFMRSSWFSSLGAGLGIASFMVPALALAVLQQKKEDTDSGSGSL